MPGLPNPGMNFTPFDPLPASDLNDMVENIESLADGSGFESSLSAMLTPTGVILSFGGSSAPTGYLLCDGSAVSRSTYAALFAVLSTGYGVGNGTTTFNVPDLRGRTPIGKDNMGGSAANRVQRTITIDTTNSSANITLSSATDVTVGMYVESTNVPDGTTILSLNGTAAVMSANASATASGTAARLSLYHDAQELGQAGGTDVHTQIAAQLAGHSHGIATRSNPGGLGANEIAQSNGTSSSNNYQSNNIFGGLFGQPMPNSQPGQITNFIVKT